MTGHKLPDLLALVLVVTSIATLLAAALHDIAARTVPNILAASLAVAGLMARALDGWLLISLGCAAAVFLTAAVCWRRGWMGGGDVKLMGAAALGVPPPLVATSLIIMSVFGALLSLLYLLGHQTAHTRPAPRPHFLLARIVRAERWRFQRGGPLPYACAIAAGGLFTLL